MRLRLQSRNSQTPTIPVAPLIDIVFITLIFFMVLSVFYQLENEISISVPKADQSIESTRSPGQIIINIDKKGEIVVNQKSLTKSDLEKMLLRLSSLYPNQPVIIRADKMTYHEKVIDVLNACAGAKIWNIAFATLLEEK